MSNQFTTQLLNEFYGAQSGDPLLSLFTLTHASFGTLRFVNNSVDIISRGETYTSLPIRVTLPADDNEKAKEVQVQFGNVELELIDEFRTVTTPIDVKLELILASAPDTVEYELDELRLRSINISPRTIVARLIMDDFLNTAVTSERYSPTNFPGIF